jgi:flavin-binding protein dodecin
MPATLEKEALLSVAKVVEITSSSTKSFEDAIQSGVARASKTLEEIRGIRVMDQKAVVREGKITEFRVDMKVTFILK